MVKVTAGRQGSKGKETLTLGHRSTSCSSNLRFVLTYLQYIGNKRDEMDVFIVHKMSTYDETLTSDQWITKIHSTTVVGTSHQTHKNKI